MRSVVVERGQSLRSIARSQLGDGASSATIQQAVTDIAKANGLTPGAKLRPQQILLIPDAYAGVTTSTTAAEHVLAFSCKGRAFCPSCIGRRMNETAALLVDQVLPPAPVRQWVVTFPIELRYRLSYDRALCNAVLGLFLRAVAAWYRRRARQLGHPGGRTGSVTVVQRASSDLRINPHFHALLLDGVYLDDDDGETPRFVDTPAPTDAEIKQLVETVAARTIRLLVQRGLLDETSCAPDPLAEDEPAMADLLQASAMGTAATGARAGRRIRRVLADPEPGQRTGDLCFCSRGFSLHAARRVRADQRGKLEELCRYVLRPPLANGRLRWLDNDTLLLALKRKWSDGTTHILLSPTELIGRLAAIVPPKGFNGVRYHGVLAPRARLRPLVVPCPQPSQALLDSTDTAHEHAEPDSPASSVRRILWADLLRRVFRKDVEACQCGGRFRLLAFITDPAETRRYLDHVGLPSAPPAIAPARAPPQVELVFKPG